MKVLLVNSSSRQNGCTFTALTIIEEELNKNEIETEIIQIGKEEFSECRACSACRKTGSGKCIITRDSVNDFINKAQEADGFIFGSPVYYAHPTGRLLNFLSRVFYANSAALKHKPAAAIAAARRAGTTASLDVIHKHFLINSMPIVSSNYWSMVFGNTPEEVMADKEGVQIMQTLGQNMAWCIKSFEAARNQGILPPPVKEKIFTNFIR